MSPEMTAQCERLIRERPILFSASMVRALLAGTKTQTRRTRNLETFNEAPDEWSPEPDVRGANAGLWRFAHRGDRAAGVLPCPYGKRGERLWVRETCFDNDNGGEWIYRADGEFAEQFEMVEGDPKWTPSIHCPRRASRILLEITEVRVQRVRSVLTEDLLAEGLVIDVSDVVPRAQPTLRFIRALNAWRSLWTEINGKGSWDANPWVWALTFKRVAP